MAKQLFNYEKIIILRGTQPGKKLGIMAGTHGNETCGVRAFEQIIPSLRVKRGEVYFIFGNPQAIKKGARFTEMNLNRCFLPAEKFTADQKKTYEYKRSRRLMPTLKKLDALLDIHSSNHPDSTPFVICEPKSYSIAGHLPVPIISSGWDKAEPGGTDGFVNKNGGRGLCVECGAINKKAETLRIAKQSIFSFLLFFGAIDFAEKIPRRRQKFVRIIWLHKTKNNFIPFKMRKDFTFVKKGTILGYDGKKEITAPRNGFIIFMCRREKPDEEAFLFGI